MTQQEAVLFDEEFDNWIQPKWLPEECPIMDWVNYKGEVYVAVLDWVESERRQKPILDLSYCMTTALNDSCWLKKGVVWNAKHFIVNPDKKR
jgi:hypothetical protein